MNIPSTYVCPRSAASTEATSTGANELLSEIISRREICYLPKALNVSGRYASDPVARREARDAYVAWITKHWPHAAAEADEAFAQAGW